MSYPKMNAGNFNGATSSNQEAPNMLRMVPDTMPMTGKDAMMAPLSMSDSLAKAQFPVGLTLTPCWALVFSMMVRWYPFFPSTRVFTQALGGVCNLLCPVKGRVLKCVMIFCFADVTKVLVPMG